MFGLLLAQMIPRDSKQRFGFIDNVPAEIILLSALMIFMLSDVVMGFMVAKNGLKVNSAATFKGMCKKAGVLMLIMLASVLEGVLGLLFKPSYPLLFNEAITVFFIAWEGLSITENLGALGVPIPESWRAALTKLRDMDKATEGQLVRLDTSAGPIDVNQTGPMAVTTKGDPLRVTQTDPVEVTAKEPLPVVSTLRVQSDTQPGTETKPPEPPGNRYAS